MSSRVKRDYTWPGKKYLGPGNSLYEGEPVDDGDWDAYILDLEYEIAENKKIFAKQIVKFYIDLYKIKKKR